MTIKTGDPVVLISTEGLGAFPLSLGQKGWANSITHVHGEGSYIFFMPSDGKEMFVISLDRVELDEEAKAAGLTLDEKTIYRGD